MVAARHSDIVSAVAELVQALELQPDITPQTMLDELTASSLRHMPGAEHVGITVAAPGGSVQTVAATDRYPAQLDEIQQRHHDGPCLLAACADKLVCAEDLARDLRWPAFCHEVVDSTPIRSILAFQLSTFGKTTAALNFYAEQPHAFDADAVQCGLVLASPVALVWHMAQRDGQFRSALASRDIIGQAKGMIMERFGIGPTQAFELLKRLSQESNTPVINVARRLVSRRATRRAL